MTNKSHITAIVPAYNEESTIGGVLKALKSSELINEIIVVNDGSTDNTFKIAKSFDVKVMNLSKNRGKSQAVKYACSKLKTDILLFCDADLVGFNHHHIKKILKPLIEKRAAMSIGLRNYGSFQNFIMMMLPLISGERAILYTFFKNALNSKYFYDYGMEPVMNDICKRRKLKVEHVILNYNHILKPKKMRRNGWVSLIKELLHVWYICWALRAEKWQGHFKI